MKGKARQIQYTIRGVPREIDAVLRRKAAQRAQSLNQVILDELAAATGGRKPRADFSDLVAVGRRIRLLTRSSLRNARSIWRSGNKSRRRHQSAYGSLSGR